MGISLLRLIIAVMIASGVAGCGGLFKNGNVPKEIVPLVVGNEWTYQDVAQPGATTQTITGTRLIGGVTNFVMRDTEGNETYLAVDEQGVSIHGAADVQTGLQLSLYLPPLRVFSYPSTVGSNWTQRVTLSTGESYDYSFTVATRELVKVPAGTFADCYRVDQTVTFADGRTLNGRAWFSPGVGMVRSQTINPMTQAVIGEQVLTGYRFH